MDCPFMWRQGICASSLTSEQADTPWKMPSGWESGRNRQTLQWEATGIMTMPPVTGILLRQALAVPLLQEMGSLRKNMPRTASRQPIWVQDLTACSWRNTASGIWYVGLSFPLAGAVGSWATSDGPMTLRQSRSVL